jgi:hypothetical protein
MLAYRIAEEQVGVELGYPIVAEQITGEYPFVGSIALEHTFVRSLDYVAVVSITGTHEVQEELVGKVFLVDGRLGIVDARGALPWANCLGYLLQLVYTAGPDSGSFVSNDSGMMALTMAAQIVLNELLTPGLLEGRVGVQEFTNMKYTEKRVKLHETIFGSSAAANYLRTLLHGLKIRRVGRL